MKLLIIRHGDPDYENDSLTPQGEKEARCLAARLLKTQIDRIYVSPLGRARKTARFYLEASGRREDAVCDWLEEFRGRCMRPDSDRERICWDWLPQDWTGFAPFYDKDHWFEHPIFKGTNVKSEYDCVTANLDCLLKECGYSRNFSGKDGNGNAATDGLYYLAERPSNDTIAFFCHFGVECVMLSHLIGVSPMVLWHGTAAAPTSVTTVATEERREGIASFRILSYGDVSHLYAMGVAPSFSARFCECYGNADERHD